MEIDTCREIEPKLIRAHRMTKRKDQPLRETSRKGD